MSYSPLKIPQKNLFILLGDQRHGPFSLDDLREKFEGGEVKRSTYLWYPGLLNWVTVGDIPDFDRRDITAPPPEVAATPANMLWVYDKGNLLAVGLEDLRQQIRDNKFRRADLIYHEGENKWLRSDQHPDFAAFFRPAVLPPALDTAAIAHPVEAAAPAAAPVVPAPPSAGAMEKPAPPPPPRMDPPAAVRAAAPAPSMPLKKDTPTQKAALGHPAKSEKAAKGAKGAPPPLESRRWTWVYPGAGVASILLVVSYAVGLWDVDMLVSGIQLASEPKIVMDRGSAAPNRAPSQLNALFPIGMTAEELAEQPDFKKCRLSATDPLAPDTYLCSGYTAALASVELSLTEKRVSRVTARMKTDEAALAIYDQWRKNFGSPWSVSAMSCTALSSVQRNRYAKACSTGNLSLVLWKDETNAVQALTEKSGGKELPLEISFTARPLAR